MIEMPDFSKTFDYENAFYLSCDKTRLSKVLAHFELFKMTLGLPGHIVECGVFKGASLVRFAMMRALFGGDASRRIIGFDTFGPFPDSVYEADREARQSFVSLAGDQSISTAQLIDALRHKGCEGYVELVAGDIRETLPAYVEAHPNLKISLLNIDTDLYEPAKVILEMLYDRVLSGGVVILDNYSTFPGETKAVDDFLAGRNVTIRKPSYPMTPCYLVKP